jgi:hypothetical protein
MHISLAEILSLVGPLDDAPGMNTARERFRTFLSKNVTEVGELRDHIEECLRTSGDQFNKHYKIWLILLGSFLDSRWPSDAIGVLQMRLASMDSGSPQPA